MSLNLKALTVTLGLLWGGALLLVGVVNLLAPGYGTALLELAASVYPGYDGPTGLGSVVVVTLYGLVDGALCGLVLGWLYNWLNRPAGTPAPESIG